MFQMYREVVAQLRQAHPELSYIYWDLGQFEDADSGIVPPALLLNIAIDWRGSDGVANVEAKLWIMDYAQSAWAEEDPAPYELAEQILASLRGMHGSLFNYLQQDSEALIPDYRGLAVSASFQCNIRRR